MMILCIWLYLCLYIRLFGSAKALLSPQADHRTAAIKHRIRRLDLSVSKKTTRDGDLISSLRSSDHPGDDLDSSTTSFEAKQTVQFYTEDQDEEERERPLIPHWKSEAWLEEATLEMLDFDVFPLGHLSKADMESINGLMAAWAKRGSLHAALSVEKLLKRIVDDMRAGNQIAHVTSRMYTYVSGACFVLGWKSSLPILTNERCACTGHRRLGKEWSTRLCNAGPTHTRQHG